jgi:sortase A
MTAVNLRRGLAAVVLAAALTACGSAGADGSATVATTGVSSTAVPATAPVGTARVVSTSTTPPLPIAAATSVPVDTVAVTGPPTPVAPPATDDPTVGLPVPAAPPTDPNGKETVRQLGSIEIPKIGITKSMYEGVTLTTLNRGPGHWPGTAMPGDVGNVVVGGHRVSHDKPFRNLDKLGAGDEVVFNTDGGRFVYTVVSTEAVTPDAIWIIDQTPERTATLFACTPPGSTSHRLVVHLALAA